MADPGQFQRDTDAYLARIRKTIADSERLVEATKLRMAETDRLLERQGLTREQVLGFRFTKAQREAVNRELARRGLDPLEDDGEESAATVPEEPHPLPSAEDATGDELAERRRKFGMMMKPFQL